VNRTRGFNLIELLIAQVIGLALLAAFLIVLQRSQRQFTGAESLARLQDAARHALAVLAADIEHAGFFGYSTAERFRLVARGAILSEQAALLQPADGRSVAAVFGLPAGAHDCGVNFAVDLARVVQGSDNRYHIGQDARDCTPTATAGGAREGTDTLTLRHASLAAAAPRAGRLQLYSSAVSSAQPLQLFADGRAPGPIDAGDEVRDLEIRTYYVANNSVERAGWPALRVKSLTESRGTVQFRDEEVMPGVEDLQVEFGVAELAEGEPVVRYVTADAPRAVAGRIVAVRLWLRIRADLTEPGHHDERTQDYANVSFTPVGDATRHRRVLIERTVALRNVRRS
jgi:type IV pilus assembly protein PilW